MIVGRNHVKKGMSMEQKAELLIPPPIEVIAVDGPSAAGKSVCEDFAKIVGFDSLDTGAIYRTAALIVIETCDDPHDPVAIERALKWQLPFVRRENGQIVFRNQVLHKEIRTKEIDELVHHVSKHPAVRQLVMPIQHRFAARKRVIAEGRDMTSVVFRDAKLKFYLTAELETRAFRRWKQRREEDKNYTGTLEQVKKELEARDHEDKTRKYCPLVCLPEAVVIDTTRMTKQHVVEEMLKIYRQNASK